MLCRPDPSEDCAQRNWPRAHLKGPEKNSNCSGWYSWQQLLPQHLNPLGQVLGVGWDRGSWYQVRGRGGGQKDPSFPKTHPCAQGTSRTFGRAGLVLPH